MKIGVIFVGYNHSEYLESLRPWVYYNTPDNPNKVVVGTVSCPFKGYEDYFAKNPPDNTDEELAIAYEAGLTSCHFDKKNIPQYLNEWEYRNAVLKKLLVDHPDLDYITQVDIDEFYTKQDINNLFEVLQKSPFVVYWRLCYKNYIFNEKTHLKEPFITPHIYKVRAGGLSVHSFYNDNEVCYSSDGESFISYSQLAGKTVPQSKVWVHHLTWLDCPKVRQKIAYQSRRWGAEDGCSYWVNPANDKLEFNPKWYTKNNKEMPEIVIEAN